jgi:hypothetical protein
MKRKKKQDEDVDDVLSKPTEIWRSDYRVIKDDPDCPLCEGDKLWSQGWKHDSVCPLCCEALGTASLVMVQPLGDEGQ